ncbi:hypothetical protein AWB67_00844 [Caballeronia terrestris]|jgi:hypothetical protein|uniref:DUF3564 domain-containing protein n=1 Tax=Caballeronia terrestris TaxID=1226301 RepID=A0A158FSZ8_9BURK|nr:DUF3564 family protein [Caballeronia terrestris]SAL22922.1 hypothetical protein AWB67_00844 [Caballeronia terrestris]
MRITVKLDAFERVDSAAFAILWLDKETRRWSREGHQSVDLPDWGGLQARPDGTLICDPHAESPLCVLEHLDFDAVGGCVEGQAGRALWYIDASRAPAAGRWHVQCIDRERITAEHGVFAGEEDA